MTDPQIMDAVVKDGIRRYAFVLSRFTDEDSIPPSLCLATILGRIPLKTHINALFLLKEEDLLRLIEDNSSIQKVAVILKASSNKLYPADATVSASEIFDSPSIVVVATSSGRAGSTRELSVIYKSDQTRIVIGPDNPKNKVTKKIIETYGNPEEIVDIKKSYREKFIACCEIAKWMSLENG